MSTLTKILIRTSWLLFLFVLGILGLIKLFINGIPDDKPFLPFGAILLILVGYPLYDIYSTYFYFRKNDNSLSIKFNWQTDSLELNKPIQIKIPFSQIDLETIDTFSTKNFHKDLFFVKILSSKLESPIHLTSATLTHKEFDKIKSFESFKSNKHKTTSRSKDIKFFKKN